MDKKDIGKALKKAWHFVWDDDSALSWVVNVILAFVLIKYLVYPGLGFLLGTSFPVVAVVSGSMEHRTAGSSFELCGQSFDSDRFVDLDFFWGVCGSWYEDRNISKSQFSDFWFIDGFNKGDIMLLYRPDPSDISVGDVIVFRSYRPDPIIHRVVAVRHDDGKFWFSTKGDHNSMSFSWEDRIPDDSYVGKAVFRIPFFGWIKIWFVEFVADPYCSFTGNFFPCGG